MKSNRSGPFRITVIYQLYSEITKQSSINQISEKNDGTPTESFT